MKATLLAFLSLASSCLAAGGPIVIRVTDEKGAAVPKADVVAILRSGAYQNTKFVNGAYVCEAAEECVKVYAAGKGYEATEKRYSGAAGEFPVSLKSSDIKNSAVIRRSGVLPGIKGFISPILDSERRLYMYSTQIGLERGAPQPVDFSLNKPINAQTGTGEKFKIYVKDITQQISLVEFTNPK